MAYDPNLTISIENRHKVIGALINAGQSASELHAMTNVGLANFYHAVQPDTMPDPTGMQRLAAEIVAETMKALGGQTVDVEAVKRIANLEAQEVFYAFRLPRELVVITPTSTVQLTGLVHYMTEDVISVLALGDNVLMVGPAGCGKTTIAEHAARALNLPFYITNVINDVHELMGFIDGYGKYHSTPFRRAFETGGVWTADEIDAWDASTLLAANSALANGYASFPDRDEPVLVHPAFRMVATANTFGTGADQVYVGRNELDAASLDRFTMMRVDYDLTLEQAFSNGQQRWLDYVWRVRKTVNEKRIRHVVSSRAIGKGARALTAGIPWPKVAEWYLFKGMSEKDRSKIDND